MLLNESKSHLFCLCCFLRCRSTSRHIALFRKREMPLKLKRSVLAQHEKNMPSLHLLHTLPDLPVLVVLV